VTMADIVITTLAVELILAFYGWSKGRLSRG
jgi:hypothetical protein